MYSANAPFKIFSGTASRYMAEEICRDLGVQLGQMKVDRFADGEFEVTFEETIRGCEVYLVLIAAGFTGCESYVSEAFGVDMTPRGTVADTKYATSQPGVFACGDMRRGQSLVVWALREGRDTAAVVDEYLMGYTNL